MTNCGNKSTREITMVKYKIEYFKCKGLIVKHREVDLSRIRTAFKLMQYTWTLVSNYKPEHTVRLKWVLVTPE